MKNIDWTKPKKIGYEIGNISWHNLDGYQELWNKADFETKEKIVNEQGRLAIELSIPGVSKRFSTRSFIIGIGCGMTLGLMLAIIIVNGC